MRDAIGGAWLYSLVIVFMLIFVSYLAISVNYSKAFRVKDGIISIIEQSEGHGNNARDTIGTFLSGNAYLITSGCGGRGAPVNLPNVGTYCLSMEDSPDVSLGRRKVHYRVTVFFRFDLPVIGRIFTFPVTGETETIHCIDPVRNCECIVDSGTSCTLDI